MNPPFDPLSLPSNLGTFPALQPNATDWDMPNLVWSNLPWDWNLMDDMRIEGINEGGGGWGNVTSTEGLTNEDYQPQASETMGMPVL